MSSSHEVIVDTHAVMLTSDGVELVSTIYRPAEEGKYPALLTRLPYGRASAAQPGYFDPLLAAKAGYVVIMQDVRGRGDSGGVFVSSINENKDGAETVAWAASLPYCDGNVGMFGRSYFSETQLRAAAEKPAGLKSLALGVCAGGNADNGAVYRGGALEVGSRFGWAHYSIAVMDPATRADKENPWSALDELITAGGWPTSTPIDNPENKFTKLDLDLIGEGVKVGPGTDYSDLWNSAFAGPYDLPTLHIGGWFDIFLLNTLEQYQAQREHTRGKHDTRLVIGPWVHISQMATYPEISFGGSSLGMNFAGKGPLHELHMRWYDHTLRGGDALASGDRVNLFVMGINKWIEAEELPKADAQRSLYLQPFGSLGWVPGDEGDATFISDPDKPVPTVGGATMLPAFHVPGPRSYNLVEQRDDLAIFTSDPLEEDLTVYGEVTAQVTIEVDAPDADVVVRLCVVDEKGQSIEMTDGITRLSQRENLDEKGRYVGDGRTSLLEPGERVTVPVMLNPTLWTVKKGQQIRVHVAGSSFPRWDANPQNGGRMYMTDDAPQKANIRIILGGETGTKVSFGSLDLTQQKVI